MLFHSIFQNWGLHDCIEPNQLEIKDTIYTGKSAILTSENGQCELMDKRYNLQDKNVVFSFPNVNFPFLCNNISAMLALVG